MYYQNNMNNKIFIFILLIFTTSSILSSLPLESEVLLVSCENTENTENHKSLKPCCWDTERDYYVIHELTIKTFFKGINKIVVPMFDEYKLKKVFYISSSYYTFHLPLKKIRLLI